MGLKDKDPSSKYGMKDIIADSRFAHIASDPRYRNISAKNLKVKVDERFKSALKNEKFTMKPALDPRGKPKNYGTKAGLHKFYDLESSSSGSDSSDDEEKEDKDLSEDDAINEEEDSDSNEDDDSDNKKKKSKVIEKQKKKVKSKTETSSESDDLKEEFMASLLNPERDLARGDAFYSDDSSDDDSSTTDEEEEELNEFEWGELDGDAIWDVDGKEVEETARFAVCDLDWDNIKAVDLLVLFSSFKPSGSCVKRVTIYPSEYGRTRLAEEELKGPQELVRLTASHKKKFDDELSVLEKLKKGTLDETDKATSLEIEALRRYQRNRLKYFYAVVECDSVETAKVIYQMCDRTHYEVIGTTLDLRYIPNDMEFDEIPHDICEKIPNSYKFENLQIDSLVRAKPTLTWDDTDRKRKKALKNAMAQARNKEDIDSDMLNDYVAGSDSDEEVDEDEEESSCSEEEGKEKKENRVAKFRALISEMNEKERKKSELAFDMEVNFEPENENDADANSENESDDEENETERLTPFEKILAKKKQKRKERKLKIKKLKENKNVENEPQSENEENSTDEEMKTKIKKNRKGKNKLKVSDVVPESTDNDLALLAMEEAEEEKKHFDMRKIQEQKDKMDKKKSTRKDKWKKKRKNDNEDNVELVDNFKVDVSDPRFAALFSQGNFNVDPSHPQYNKHSSLNTNIVQKQKKVRPNPPSEETQINNSKMDADISSLIKRVRMKTSKLK